MPKSRFLTALLVATVSVVAGNAAQGAPPAKPRFRIVDLPKAVGGTEPTLAVDSRGRIYASPIFGLGNLSVMGTPVFRSTDGGATFTKHSTAHAGPAGTPFGGGDTALITDKRDYVYATDLWVGNDSIAFSTDQGATWTGSPASHRMVGDRNWLAYSKPDDALYQLWNGFDGLYVSRADLGTPLGPNAALSFAYNYRVAGELVGVPGSYTRANSGPPGGIAVDQREGVLYATWSDQEGVAVARSGDRGATWTIGHIPGTKVTASYFDTAWMFTPVGVDPRGNVFVAWSQITGSVADPDRISTYLAVSRDQGRSWRKTRLSTRATSVFPAMTVTGTDRVAMSWIDTSATGDPNKAADFSDAAWRLQYAEVTGLAAARPRTTYLTVESVIHKGTVYVGPQGGDRSMGDFTSIAATPRGGVVLAYTKTTSGRSQPRVATLSPRGR